MDTVYKAQAKVFKAFCDPKRLAILEQLRSGEKCACVLLEPLDLTQSGRMRLPHQVRNQRMHSGRCKEHRWVIFRDQGSGRNHGMPAFAEKLEVECAQFLGSQVFHGITPHL